MSHQHRGEYKDRANGTTEGCIRGYSETNKSPSAHAVDTEKAQDGQVDAEMR